MSPVAIRKRKRDPQTIVAEVSTNWCVGKIQVGKELTSAQFEKVIGVNRARGYILKSWQFQQTLIPGAVWNPDQHQLVETIIAVFERVKAKA